MARSKTPGETEALTLRLNGDLIVAYRSLAAQTTLQQGSGSTVTAQDLMRDWLGRNPALKLLAGKAETK
jgi:hypothetical protein